MFERVLNDDSFLLYCAQHYRNPACTGTEEFMSDIRRIKYIKKLCTRYISTGDLKERLILNHIIVLGNVFEPIPLNRILFLKMEQQFHIIKPFLLYLSILTDNIENVKENRIVDTTLIPMEPKVINSLREIDRASTRTK